mgnify:FL=1
MPDDDGYVYQEFFSDENLDEFKNKNVGCFTMLIIIIILIMLFLLPIVTIELTYFAITSPETFFEDGTKNIFLLVGLYALIIGIVIFIIYQYHKNKKK